MSNSDDRKGSIVDSPSSGDAKGADEFASAELGSSDAVGEDQDSVTRRVVTTMQQLSVGMGPPWITIADKINPEHISTILNNAERNSVRHFESRKASRIYNFLYACLGVWVSDCWSF